MKIVSLVLPVLGAVLISSSVYAGGPAKQAQGKVTPAKQVSTARVQNQGKTDMKQPASNPVAMPNKVAAAKPAATNSTTQTGSQSAHATKRHHHSNRQTRKSGVQ